jgi:hypothetical protein
LSVPDILVNKLSQARDASLMIETISEFNFDEPVLLLLIIYHLPVVYYNEYQRLLMPADKTGFLIIPYSGDDIDDFVKNRNIY